MYSQVGNYVGGDGNDVVGRDEGNFTELNGNFQGQSHGTFA
ncbi:MAG: hypothetical protein QGG53_11260 [Planctomycetota bacterium]|nr:hypothetical protein [Planctomycetota bacterium]